MIFTPTLILGAITVALFLLKAVIADWPAASKPVVPITARTRCWAQALSNSSVASGRVKSIKTSAARRAAVGSAEIAIPEDWPMKSPASFPIIGLLGCSRAAASVIRGWASTASISMRPIFPVAPEMAIRVALVMMIYRAGRDGSSSSPPSRGSGSPPQDSSASSLNCTKKRRRS